MTNKVKPFYIRITDDMTPQMVQDAFDKCHKLGVRASNNDDIENLFDWFYFGVCARDGTYLSESEHGYFDAQEITLDQLDEWLGLEPKVEWKNGDRCAYRGSVAVVIGWHPNQNVVVIDSDDFGLDSCSPCELSKPESPEQKAERERLENGRDLWLKHQQALADVKILPSGKNKAWDSNMLSKDEMESWCILAENVTWMK